MSSAAVTINEIAWMGTTISANDEWIELYNNGTDDVSLEGWTITDEKNLEISLDGTIQTGQYAVLERTNDDTVEGTAFLTYSGALINEGATLVLRRADGISIEDQIAGGENWINIGGDNVTKETAQYTDSGWTTASPTPGYAIANYSEDVDEEPVAQITTSVSNTSTDKAFIELHLPNVSLSLSLDIPDIAYVHQPVLFSVTPSGLGDGILNSLQYQWNFGDVSISTNKNPTHSFSEAGEFVVTVYASYARHEQVARKTITVLPVSFSLARNSDGDILVHNKAKYEVDISQYTIKGNSSLVFPHRSILLPNATLTIHKEKLKSEPHTNVSLYDQENSLVASLSHASYSDVVVPLVHVVDNDTVVAPTPVAPQEEISESDGAFLFKDEVVLSGVTTSEPIKVVGTEKPSIQYDATVIESSERIPDNTLPYLGLFGVLSVGMFAVFAGRIH